MSKDVAKIIICSVGFVCITIAAVIFQNVNVLWWYILPAFIAVD
jgi:hypothetical protein